ncbi:FAD-dependent monooxygenase [Streptomyces sp. CA-111067]|uniref:FAD-dependent monooxygenase n=1 Tax=Streptomyces sp. CA-111067 TaxID=3240046 RepID=UPI003D99F56C
MSADPTSTPHTPVLIVGAGPAGLVLACDLARRGIAHRLIELDAADFAGARGKGLQPRTQEVFEDLGLLDAVRAHGGPYPPMRAYRDGETVWEGRMDEIREPTPDVPYPNAWMLPQWRTGELLRDRLAALGGSVERGTALVSFTQDADGVTALLRHSGGDGDSRPVLDEEVRTEEVRDEEVRADYLIGADGGRSTVRRTLGVGFAGETREEQRTFLADVRADGLDRDHWHVWQPADPDQARYALAMCPLAGTDTFQLTQGLPPDVPVPQATLPELQQRVDAAAGAGRVRLTEVVWHSLYRANMRMAERFRTGRVFLVGDAAHVHSPAGGQGLNTGVQDAYNLGWKLAAVLAGAPAGLLDSYEEERLPVAADVLGISTRLHDKGVAGDADAHRRDDPVLHQLGLGYRGASLSREERTVPGPVTAGDRAPDAPGTGPHGEPVRLFDLFRGPHATLLAFGEKAATEAAALTASIPSGLRTVAILSPGERPPAGIHPFTDTAAHARTAYGPQSDGTLLLIRPDGYIGLTLDATPTAARHVLPYLSATSRP